MNHRRSPSRDLGARRSVSGGHDPQRGSALFLLLIVGVVSVAIIGGIFTYISVMSKGERRSDVRLESTYAAEYAFEQAYQQLNTLIGQNTVNLPGVADTSGVTNLTTAPTSTFGAADGYTWKSFITVPVEDGVPVTAHSNFNPTQGVYKFMTVVEFDRTTSADSTPAHMQFQREWNYTITPLFQYAIFYNGNMELFPGAAFNVNGRVHSNGRIYTGTTASITFGNMVTDVDGVSNNYMPADPRTRQNLNGPITYTQGPPVVTTSKNPPGQMGSNTSDSNDNNDGSHELIELPDVHDTDPNSSERMYNKAGLKVLVNSTSSDTASDIGLTIPANSQVYLTADGTQIPSTDPLATYLATLTSSGTMKDYREAATVTTVDVDLSKVTAAYNAGGLPQTIPNSATWPNNSSVPAALKNQPIPTSLQGKSLWNGIMYVADVTNSSAHRVGVKLVNGTKLPDGTNSSSPVAGLTVATANAAYIVGDYNTGGTPPVDSGSNLAANNYASGYTVQPASVIADAVTVVSSNWVSGSYNSQSSVSSRPATNTTINTALISGIVATDSTAYSGGVENYIRLLENWGGKRLTYYGSMVNVYNSQQSTAKWGNSNYYSPPARNWYFDTNFLDPNKLPPGTPVLRSLMRGQWAQIE